MGIIASSTRLHHVHGIALYRDNGEDGDKNENSDGTSDEEETDVEGQLLGVSILYPAFIIVHQRSLYCTLLNLPTNFQD